MSKQNNLRDIRDRGEDRSRSRERGRGRGSVIDYYEDLGIGTSKEGYSLWKENEAAFEKNKADNEKVLSEYESSYRQLESKGPGEVPSYDSLYDKAWNDFKKKTKFIPVRVVDKDKIEGTYYLPTSTAAELQRELDKYYHTTRTGSWMNIDVKAKGGGGKRGQEIHDAVRKTEQAYKSAFNSTADRQIRNAISNAKRTVSTNKEVIASSKANWENAKNEYGTFVKTHSDANQKYKDDYKQRLSNIARAIGAVNYAK